MIFVSGRLRGSKKSSSFYQVVQLQWDVTQHYLPPMATLLFGDGGGKGVEKKESNATNLLKQIRIHSSYTMPCLHRKSYTPHFLSVTSLLAKSQSSLRCVPRKLKSPHPTLSSQQAAVFGSSVFNTNTNTANPAQHKHRVIHNHLHASVPIAANRAVSRLLLVQAELNECCKISEQQISGVSPPACCPPLPLL